MVFSLRSFPTQVEFVVGIYAVVRMYRMQKQQFYQFEYVMNQRRRNAAYNVEESKALPHGGSGGGGIGSNKRITAGGG